MTLTRFANAASKPIHSTWATGNHMITKTNIAQLLARNVDEIHPPEWRAVVDQAVRVLANATPAEQQIGVAKLADRYGPEAANEAEAIRGSTASKGDANGDEGRASGGAQPSALVQPRTQTHTTARATARIGV
jgi:hypothetical protein